jgi:hypothetical protein
MSKHICPVCKEKVGEEYKVYKKRRYHIKCYRDMVKKLYEKEESEKPEREKLEEYIIEIYGKITGMIDAQINKYITEKEYKYSGILYTLKYYYDILENKKTENINGIGIVPLYYEEAKDFFILKQNLKKKDTKANYKKNKVKVNKENYKIENKIINIDNL